MRKYGLRLAQSEKIEISVQALDVRDEWRGKLLVRKVCEAEPFFPIGSARLLKNVRTRHRQWPYVDHGIRRNNRLIVLLV